MLLDVRATVVYQLSLKTIFCAQDSVPSTWTPLLLPPKENRALVQTALISEVLGDYAIVIRESKQYLILRNTHSGMLLI